MILKASADAGGSSSMHGPGNHRFNPRNAKDVFAEFFGSNKPFEGMGRAKSMRFQTEGADNFGGFGGNENRFRSYNDSVGTSSSQPRKPPAVETKLPCTLEELYTSSTRKMKISRNIVKPNGVLNLNNSGYFTAPYGQNVIFVENDCHTAVLPCYLKSMYKPNGIYVNAEVAFCIHSIAYRG